QTLKGDASQKATTRRRELVPIDRSTNAARRSRAFVIALTFAGLAGVAYGETEISDGTHWYSDWAPSASISLDATGHLDLGEHGTIRETLDRQRAASVVYVAASGPAPKPDLDRGAYFDGYTAQLSGNDQLRVGTARQFAEIGEFPTDSPNFPRNFDRPVDGSSLFLKAEF
ncbi:MAG: hypothetical protein AAFQ84_05785, partial [Pseudomonadota bacterium]